MAGTPKSLRSRRWFGPANIEGFIHRTALRNDGRPQHLFDGRPVIGICNTWSELTPCNVHFRSLAEYVKRGVYEMGGFPLEFPVMSLGESLMRPTTMLYRNLAAMDVEETIRSNPIDGVVLLCGCDKTTPALVMGAASCDVPALVVSGGPMLNGKFRGRDIGSGTDIFAFSEAVRAGEMSLPDFFEAEGCMSRSHGACMTMGTASTMAALIEALGLALPGTSAIPAPDSRRSAMAHMAGRRIVELVQGDIRMSRLLGRPAFENAIRVNAAIGGSTNAVVHLLAIAGRLGTPLDLDDWDRLGRDVPCLVNVMPAGQYLMEDFYYAGGLPAVMREILDLLHGDALTVSGQTVAENVADAPCWNREVIAERARPFKDNAGIAVLRGNLAPDGAVIKTSAASPELMRFRGRAVVFEDIDDYHARIDDPALDVTPGDALILRNCGPKGYPGFPEVGNMGLPKKLLAGGVKDMVRISDARMSGTAYGTIVLHVAPEAAAGGPLGLVRSGDMVELDVAGRRLHLDVAEEILAERRQVWQPPKAPAIRGWWRLYYDHVQQADRGADLDILVGASGTPDLRANH